MEEEKQRISEKMQNFFIRSMTKQSCYSYHVVLKTNQFAKSKTIFNFQLFFFVVVACIPHRKEHYTLSLLTIHLNKYCGYIKFGLLRQINLPSLLVWLDMDLMLLE